MLIEPVISKRRSAPIAKRQRGVVLVIALIVLVAMTLAGLALVRSVDTSNLIAGNLAFKSATTYASTAGTEAAITWLQTNNVGSTLEANNSGAGYSAFRQPLAPGQSWDSFWTTVLAAQAAPSFVDGAGNTVTYAIERMCNAVGAPSSGGVGCPRPPKPAGGGSVGNSMASGIIPPDFSNQIFYRITTRIVGPRNTVSYVQTFVAL